MPFQFRKEAIEENLNSNFPSQGQGNPPLYYSLSEVVVPTYSINSVAEGSALPQNLQTAWDYSTGEQSVNSTTANLVTNTGFWQFDLINTAVLSSSVGRLSRIELFDGVAAKKIWSVNYPVAINNEGIVTNEARFVVFVRSGDLVRCTSSAGCTTNVWYRQIADLNGNLVNPLGYSAA